LSYNILETK